MPRVPLSHLRSVCQKSEKDPLWLSQYVGRPLSIRVTWLCVWLGLNSNQVTFLSLLFALAGSASLLFPSTIGYALAAAFNLTFFLLDHVDGEVARYQRSTGVSSSGAAGAYYDRLVHYFQGPSFYICLAGGIAVLDQSVWWLVAGVAAAIGNSGFPRFNAAFELLNRVLADRQNEPLQKVAAQVADFNSLYWLKNDPAKRMFLIPRNLSDLKIITKQAFTFPGNLFVFALVAAVDPFLELGIAFPLLRLFLITYSTVLLVNTVYSTRHYLSSLSSLK